MIHLLIIYKLKFFFRQFTNPWNIVVTLFLLITAWAYGAIFGVVSNKLTSGETGIISPEQFRYFIFAAVSGITLIRMVFPNYIPMKQLFPKYYPVTRIERYVASLVADFQKPFFFYILVFIFSVYSYLEVSSWHFLATGLLVCVNSQLVRRFLQYLIDYETKSSMWFVHTLGALAILSVIVALIFADNEMPYLLLFLLLILASVGFFQETSIISCRQGEILSKSIKLHILPKLLLNNKKARTPLIIGLLFKSFILLMGFLAAKLKGKHLFDEQIVLWLFATPLILFTYVFNNMWGFWKSMWLNLELRNGQHKVLVGYGLRLMLIPLIIDFLVTMPLLLLSGNDFKFLSIYYLTTTLYLVAMSFFWSLITPRKIMSFFHMKASTSAWSMIAAMGGVLALITIKMNYWFYVLIPFFILVGFTCFWISLQSYRNKKYLIATSILKEQAK